MVDLQASSSKPAASQPLDRDFLEIRARLLEVAAALDRAQRAGAEAGDPRLIRIRQAIEILQQSDATRAEQIQLLFSRPYDEAWRRGFGIE